MKEPPAQKKKQYSPRSCNALFGFSVIIVGVACFVYFYLPKDKVDDYTSTDDSQENEDGQGLPLFSAKELSKFDGIRKSS